MSGKHLTGTVIYGYLWDEKREHWLVDEEAAEVVRHIFALAMEGLRPLSDCNQAVRRKNRNTRRSPCRYGEGVNKNKTFADIYRWSASTVVEILKKREYLGHTVNFKTRKHFKDKKSHYVDESEWTIFENTHEAIIDQQPLTMCSVSGKRQTLPGRLWGGPSLDRPDVLRRLRRQECLFTVPTTASASHSTLAASMGSTLSAPFALHSTVSRRSCSDPDNRYAPSHRGVFQE